LSHVLVTTARFAQNIVKSIYFRENIKMIDIAARVFLACLPKNSIF